MAKLSHPNIVGVYDFGETADGLLYIVMEYVEGTDLATLIRAGELQPDHALRWVPQMCEALEYAHENGVVHRDIKPSNVLIAADGSGVKIADFGIARLSGENEAKRRMTMTDVAVGTPDYVAPEQMEGGSKVDHRADIYSLGVLMYEMLTGQVPRGVWKPPSERKPGESVTRRFDPIVHRAMQSEPADRYQRVSEVLTDVHGINRPEQQDEPGGKKWVLIVAGSLALAMAAILVPKLFKRDSPDEQGAGSEEVSKHTVVGKNFYPTAPPVAPIETVGAEPAEPGDIAKPVYQWAAMRSERRSWLSEDYWINGPPPSSGDAEPRFHYRLHPSARLDTRGGEVDCKFGGLSLIIDPGATLRLSPASDEGGRGRIYMENLQLGGGHLHFPLRSRFLDGNIGVFADSTIESEGGKGAKPVVLSAKLYGSGRLSYLGAGSSLWLKGVNKDFSGGWNIRGNLEAHATGSLGTGPITIERGRVESRDTVRLAGGLEIYSPGKVVLDQFWEVDSARIDGREPIPAGDYRHEQLVELGFGDVFDKGSGMLRVREDWQPQESVPPFAPDSSAPLVDMTRAQRRGASLHHPAPWGDQPTPKIVAMLNGKLESVTGRHYLIRAGGSLRTEFGSMSTDHFSGLSLTVETGGTLHLCGLSGTLVVHDLRLEGGQILPDMDVSRMPTSARGGIGGHITVSQRSLIGRSSLRLRDQSDRKIVISASLSGPAPLIIDSPDIGAVVIDSRDNDGFSGGWEVESGTLRGNAPGALGSGAITVRADAKLEMLAAQKIGRLLVEEGAGLLLDSDCSSKSAMIAGKELPAGEHEVKGSKGKLIVLP